MIVKHCILAMLTSKQWWVKLNIRRSIVINSEKFSTPLDFLTLVAIDVEAGSAYMGFPPWAMQKCDTMTEYFRDDFRSDAYISEYP